ncbi:hypothetical protein [Photobacterium sp. OFAV2-7]|uniref:hypothetical protein n=1 Tax=Photobacterium sp. OFAV2-7 TaxID=2917748 RepID=UPI001EF700B2|nr:hypothetical protein [Photobacterium sp. OFAV2-7]MCG7584957.1 hypothetical protein [Photobacterium sp. OFAV2-7]
MMKTIRKFDEVENLPVPLAIKDQLHRHLTEPFDGDVEVTRQFWNEVSTTLFLIEESDVDDTLAGQSEDIQHLLRFVTHYPEFVLLLNDNSCNWLLALAVITSEGAGCYIVAPMSSKTYPVLTLADQAEA